MKLTKDQILAKIAVLLDENWPGNQDVSPTIGLAG